jgi:hypothetical protein
MPSSPQRPPLDTYIAEVARLRALPFDELHEEVDRLTPMWIALRVVPGV